MTDKELISKIQALKQIKPNQEWVVFVRRQVLGFDINKGIEPTYKKTFLEMLHFLFQKKLAYAFAVLLLLFAGAFSFIKLSKEVKVADKSPAALVAESTIKNNVETFKKKSQILAEAVKNKSQGVSLALQEVKSAVKELTDAIQRDPRLAKTVALDVNNNKTYLDVTAGNDLKATSDVLYKTIDSQMIEDLGKTTLTEDQQKALDAIKDFYNQGSYVSALENILLLNSALKNN